MKKIIDNEKRIQFIENEENHRQCKIIKFIENTENHRHCCYYAYSYAHDCVYYYAETV